MKEKSQYDLDVKRRDFLKSRLAITGFTMHSVSFLLICSILCMILALFVCHIGDIIVTSMKHYLTN